MTKFKAHEVFPTARWKRIDVKGSQQTFERDDKYVCTINLDDQSWMLWRAGEIKQTGEGVDGLKWLLANLASPE